MAYRNFQFFLEEILNPLDCEPRTKAYITSIYTKQIKDNDGDLSKKSLTLLFGQAKESQDFLKFQNIADWIFFSNTIAPDHLNHASQQYYQTLAKLSYYNCYKLINRQWKLFEELADKFEFLEKQTKNLMIGIQLR